MEVDDFVTIYPHLVDGVDNITTLDQWINGIVDNPIVLNFNSEVFYITEDIFVNYHQNKLPQQFYDFLIDTIETHKMTYVIIEDDNIMFKKPCNQLAIGNYQTMYKILILEYLARSRFDLDQMLDKIIHKLDQCPQDTKNYEEIKVLVEHLSGEQYHLGDRFLYNLPQPL